MSEPNGNVSEVENKATGPQPEEETDRLAMPVDQEEKPRLPFPVVGVGASAGGLPAFTAFLKAMRPDNGIAFVLIQHLPPERESMMAEILQKHTAMPVAQVEEGVEVRPNHVYVIRPGHRLSIEHGKLHLHEILGPKTGNRPVDDFFRSLAEEQRERAICIIMSGMGSNGTAGAQAVKAAGGLCIAQDPETCEFPSMPRHLIDQGYADYILRPEDMPDVLLTYAGSPYTSGNRGGAEALRRRDEQHFREILAILRTRTRQDFSGYKRPTLLRRVQRRMGLARVLKIGEYAKLLRQSPSEVAALADDMLIHVTGFFRDRDAWETLRERVVVPLIASREQDSSVRAWVTACSSGEEAYSLAILLVEEAERADKRLDIKVFATDTAERTLANARAGIYPVGIESEITSDRLERFFEKDEAVYRVRPQLREAVVFAPQNVLHDPPFSRLDIITCRNLLIYLEPDIQQRILSLLHFGLREGGVLFLGTSETVAGAEELFEPLDKSARIFRRIGPRRHGTIGFPVALGLRGLADSAGLDSSPRVERRSGRVTLAHLTEHALLEHHTPAAVLVDRNYRILYFHGNTSQFLDQPRGEPTRELMALVGTPIRSAVRVALHRAATEGSAVTVLEPMFPEADRPLGEQAAPRHRIAVTASPLPDLGYFVVSFEKRLDVLAPPGKIPPGDPVELQRVRDELQTTIEELQTSNEELKASNEEVTSINEELQSTNEELETSKEEMQSLNEELTTLNSQLQVKMDELQSASSDLASLLTSTDIAVLFLDPHLRIRRFTPAVRQLLDLISSDVGRPLADLNRKFTDPHLDEDARSVLERLVPVEREVAAASGSHFVRKVLPYRTADDRIDGLVITFVDVTDRKRMENALRESQQRLTDALATARMAWWQWDPATDRMFATDTASLVFGLHPGQTLESSTRGFSLVHPDDIDRHRAMVAAAQQHAGGWHTEYRIIRPCDAKLAWIEERATPAPDPATGKLLFNGLVWDITDRKQADTALRETETRFRLMMDAARDFAVLMTDPHNRITSWTAGAEHLLGWTEQEMLDQSATLIFTPQDRADHVPERELEHAQDAGFSAAERWHLRKDGSRFWASGSLHALRGSDGQITGYVKVLRDETARKQAEDAADRAREAAADANHTRDEFLATLSHELRTPLSAILLWAKMLSSAHVPPEQLTEGLAAIAQSAEAQRALIDDLLDMSRVASGKLRLDLQGFELGPAIKSAVEAVRPTADVKEITLNADIPAEPLFVAADPDRLRQIVWNLLTNAVKFTSAGGRVEVSLRRAERDAVIVVQDNGQGIEPNFLPHVFEPFRQAGSVATRIHGGLGLGLAIVRQLVELHGGNVRAESPGTGKGARFVVTLPLQTDRRGREVRKPSAAPSARALHGMKILLVEDEPLTRMALAMLLERAGAEVTGAESTPAAVEAFQKARPHVIISDIGLPGEDGYNLLKRIRSLEGTGPSPIPAVALTAFARDQDRDAATAAGYQRHVAKPVDPEQLLSVVADVATDRSK